MQTRVLMDRRGEKRAKKTTHSHAINLLINTIIKSKVEVFGRQR